MKNEDGQRQNREWLVEQRDGDTEKSRELLRAVEIGIDALDRGEFKEFRTIQALQTYLNGLADKIISGAVSRER